MGDLENHGLVGGTNTYEGTSPITSALVVAPYVGFVNSQKVIGSMIDRGGEEFAGYRRATEIASNPSTNGVVRLKIPSGAYRTTLVDGEVGVFIEDAQYLDSNILKGRNLVGLVGTVNRTANGSGTGAGVPVEIRGLEFQPSKFNVRYQTGGKEAEFIYDLSVFLTNAILAYTDNSFLTHFAPTIYSDGFRFNAPTNGTPYTWFASE